MRSELIEGSKKNKGWKCGHCSFKAYGEKSLNKTLAHIQELHPIRWLQDNWIAKAIRSK